MLVYEKTSVYLAVELSLREIYYVLYARALILRALMTQKSCAVGMCNAKLGNHLKKKNNNNKGRDVLFATNKLECNGVILQDYNVDQERMRGKGVNAYM